MRQNEFYGKYPMKSEIKVPAAFINNTVTPESEIAIQSQPSITCDGQRMVTFIKTGRGNVKEGFQIDADCRLRSKPIREQL